MAGERGFNFGDNLDTGGGDDDTRRTLSEAMLSGALQRVSDRGDTAQNGGPAPTETPAQRQLAEALAAFDAAENKPEAIKQLAPRFEGAIRTADDAAKQTLKAIQQELATMTPEAIMAAKMEAALDGQRLLATLEQIPAGKQRDRVVSAVNAYTTYEPGEGMRVEAEKVLAKYPGMTEAVQAADRSSKNPLILRNEELTKQGMAVITDQVMTRVGYADALKEGGDPRKAWKMFQDAGRIMGVEIPDQEEPNRGIEVRVARNRIA